MSNIKLLTVTNAPQYAEVLIRSAKLHGWDLEVINCEWKGFGTKLIETYNYLKSHPEVEHFIFCDAFDVVILGKAEELITMSAFEMVLSAEKGLWPPILQPFRDTYTDYGSLFRYPNSGLYYAKSKYFKWLYEKYKPFYEIDDQYWMNMCYILEHDVHYDYEQMFFNSHSFIDEGEYGYDNGRIQILGNEPVFVHSNGKTEDPRLDELIKNMLA